MSLFSVMNVANKALHASQIGMEVSSQNLANSDVPGYSRKRMELAADYHRHGTFGQFGFGVSIIGINRIRNEYIDAQIRRQTHELGKNKAVDYTLESLENILREPSDTGILEYMNRFFDSWENLTNNPSDLSARNNVTTNANMLVDVFHNVYSELQNLKNTRNQEIVATVDKINNIASEIFSLNGEISIVELGGNSANDSKDRRDQLMRDLSELIDFETNFDASGQVTIIVTGNILVSPVSVNHLEVYEDATTRVNDEGYHQYGVRMSKGRNQIKPTGGTLKGLMISRDEVIPKFEAQIDELAYELIKKINQQHKVGFNLHGFSGFNFFDPIIEIDGLERNIKGASKIIKLSASITTDTGNIAAARGGSSKGAGVNEFNPGTLLYGIPPADLTYQLSKSGTIPVTNPDDRATNIVYGTLKVTVGTNHMTDPQLIENVDYRIDYVAGTIQMLNPIHDADNICVSFDFVTSNFPGVGNNENALAISLIRKNLTMHEGRFGNPTSTFDQFYSSTIAQLGLDRTETMAEVRTREYLVEQYDTHQDSIAGVSLDEEFADLIKYQNAYQAAARIFTTAQTMLDILMNL